MPVALRWGNINSSTNNFSGMGQRPSRCCIHAQPPLSVLAGI